MQKNNRYGFWVIPAILAIVSALFLWLAPEKVVIATFGWLFLVWIGLALTSVAIKLISLLLRLIARLILYFAKVPGADDAKI